MANSAFDHEPTLTLPVSSTNTALVTWTGTGADTLGNSTILVGATTMGLAADTDLLTFGNGTIAITGAVTGVTALTVDNLNINGNTFTATSGAVNITPAAGSAIVLDGAVNVDAGVVTGATSITSTEFVGGGVGITALAAANITASGTLPVLNGSNLTALTSANLTGALPAISGANLTNLPAGGATINNATANELVTVASTTTQLDAEANLTYDGAELNVGGTSAKLVLDQGSGDGYIFELRSTDVAHGISGYNTNTYGQFMKKHPTSGMLQIWGFSDADANQAIGLSITGVSGIAANTTKTTAAIGIVEILGGIKNGSAIANAADAGNILVIRDAASGSAKMIVGQDGDVRVNENTKMPSVTKGIAKAWLSYDYSGSTPTIMGSYNISSLGDSNTGHVIVYYTNSLDAAHAATVGMTQTGTLGSNMTGTSQSTTKVDIKSSNPADAAADLDGSVVIFGVSE